MLRTNKKQTNQTDGGKDLTQPTDSVDVGNNDSASDPTKKWVIDVAEQKLQSVAEEYKEYTVHYLSLQTIKL